jgi:hypothetical protein
LTPARIRFVLTDDPESLLASVVAHSNNERHGRPLQARHDRRLLALHGKRVASSACSII